VAQNVGTYNYVATFSAFIAISTHHLVRLGARHLGQHSLGSRASDRAKILCGGEFDSTSDNREQTSRETAAGDNDAPSAKFVQPNNAGWLWP
jgi:hypothetical protein